MDWSTASCICMLFIFLYLSRENVFEILKSVPAWSVVTLVVSLTFIAAIVWICNKMTNDIKEVGMSFTNDIKEVGMSFALKDSLTSARNHSYSVAQGAIEASSDHNTPLCRSLWFTSWMFDSGRNSNVPRIAADCPASTETSAAIIIH